MKRVCICDYGKNRIVTCEKCVFGFELGYKQKSVPGSPKHTARAIRLGIKIQVNIFQVKQYSFLKKNTKYQLVLIYETVLSKTC